MPVHLRPFGEGSLSHDAGYTLDLLIGHIECMYDQETGRLKGASGPLYKRVEKVEKALELLRQCTE